MNQTLLILIILGIMFAAGLVIVLVIPEARGMYEDQFLVCNFKNICQVIDIDDYISKNASDKLWYNFNHDLDTFTFRYFQDDPYFPEGP